MRLPIFASAACLVTLGASTSPACDSAQPEVLSPKTFAIGRLKPGIARPEDYLSYEIESRLRNTKSDVLVFENATYILLFDTLKPILRDDMSDEQKLYVKEILKIALFALLNRSKIQFGLSFLLASQ